MDKKLFRIILIPMYLLIGLLLLCTMVVPLVHYFNVFFYVITLLFIPCAGLLSWPNRHSFHLAGMAGFVVLGILLPVTQSLEFEFQGVNGWILIGVVAIISGIGGYIYQIRQRA